MNDTPPPCGSYCPGDCGWKPDDPDDPCNTALDAATRTRAALRADSSEAPA